MRPMTRIPSQAKLLLLSLSLLGTAAPSRADAFDDWPYSTPIKLNTTASGANVTGNVSDFPVLIRLNATNFNFDQAKTDGSDVRFFHNVPGTGAVELPREIERWDKTNKLAEVWVLVDQVLGNNGDQAIVMRWGNLSAPAAPLTSVFTTTNNFRGVWHMDASGSTLFEAAQAHNGTKKASGEPATSSSGLIGNAQDFDGSNDYANLGGNFNWINGASQVTVQAWVRREDNAGKIIGFSRNGGTNSRVQLGVDGTTNKAFLEARSTDTENPLSSTPSSTSLSANTWYLVTGMVDFTAKTITMCVNSACDAPTTANFSANSLPTSNSSNAVMGAEETLTANFFGGKIDEVRISNVARSADWIKLCYQNQISAQKLVQFQSQFLPLAGGVVYGDVNMNGYDLLNASMVMTKKWKIPTPDYVFEDGYALPGLTETAKYIKENRHLPGIPSAKQLESEGMDLASMNLQLLKQLEHMQLYIFQLEDRIKAVEERKP